MTDPELQDPRALAEEELATEPELPRPADPEQGDEPGHGPVVDDVYAEGSTSDPEGAQRPEPAGQDYAGSGF